MSIEGGDGQIDFPEGRSFLQLIAEHEAKCQSRTWSALPAMGEKAPRCFDGVGTVLALLDSAASCFWGCHQGDHRGEFLLGRVASSAYAALRLSTAGYYDQALSIVRTLGENANLIALFNADPPSFERWKNLPERDRRNEFKPVSVRLALEALGAPLPVDKDRYAALSDFSIHASPNAMPQAHNAAGRPLTFGVFQEAGLVLVLNELALPLTFVAIFASDIVKVPPKIKRTLLGEGRSLASAIGGVSVLEKGRPWFRLN
ncbi:MAG TPA: hypothetical protein VF574_12245 [Allosphingosinicella sp.]